MYLGTCRRNHKKIGSANRTSADRHIFGRCVDLKNCLCSKICEFAIGGTNLVTFPGSFSDDFRFFQPETPVDTTTKIVIS
jgi:hypothetical protein